MRADKYIYIRDITVYLLMLIFMLVIGSVFKVYTVIVYYGMLIVLIMNNRIDAVIMLLVAWIFTYRFFLGQNWVGSQSLIYFLYNHNLSIIMISIVFYQQLGIAISKFTRSLGVWCIMTLAIYVISDIYHGQMHINTIYAPAIGLLYFIIRNISRNKYFNKKMLSLLISIGILQLLISVLQITGVVAPHVTSVDTGDMLMYREAHIADVATGTMGSNASNDTSWIETVLFAVLFTLGVYTHKTALIVGSSALLLQYATVDSKTGLGITVGVLCLMITQQILKKRINAKILASYVLFFLPLYGIYTTINYYYTAFVEHGGTEQSQEVVESSINIALDDFGEWGKIRGFVLITDDLIQRGDRSAILFGYGRDNYANTNTRLQIEAMLPDKMRTNNFLNNFSSLINTYGEMGISGIMILLSFLYICMRHIVESHYVTPFGKSFKISGSTILIGSLAFMFVSAGISIHHLSFMLFAILMALVDRDNQYSAIQHKPPSILLNTGR